MALGINHFLQSPYFVVLIAAVLLWASVREVKSFFIDIKKLPAKLNSNRSGGFWTSHIEYVPSLYRNIPENVVVVLSMEIASDDPSRVMQELMAQASKTYSNGTESPK
ncbi:MAG: hypothetical protein Q9199_005321 [Rusavskia elegans]